VAKPKKKTKRTVKKVSRKGSGGKKSGSPAASGRGVAKARKSANTPKRSGGLPATIGALPPLGEASIPVAAELAKLGSSDNQSTPQQLSLPVYGNYCGPGHDDHTGKTPPVDAVDAVCREHNMCYRRLGSFDSRCDRDLIKSMPAAIASTPSAMGKKAGSLALLYFSLVERNLALGQTLLKKT
jgi:hypothetical protein